VSIRRLNELSLRNPYLRFFMDLPIGHPQTNKTHLEKVPKKVKRGLQNHLSADIPSTTGSQLEADLLEARGWASVGRSGVCVHSKFEERCAGCMIRELQWAVKDMVDLGEGSDVWLDLKERAERVFKRIA
jgi:hypothetical protein